MMRTLAHLAWILTLATLAGCAAVSRDLPERPPDRTTIMVDLYVVDAEEKTYVRYRVERDGELRYAGGLDAIEARFTWTGPLTDDEIARLEGIVAGLPARVRMPKRERPPRMATVEAENGDDQRTLEVAADDARVTGLHTLLETASRRRFEKILDSLPKPGPHP